MTATPKKKLCWNCEGRVSFTEENCPFCGVYVSPSNPGENSLLKPPYLLVEPEEEQSIPPSPYGDKEHIVSEDTSYPQKEEITESRDLKNGVASIAMMLSGTVFLLFGIVLWLFSDKEVFTLHWETQYWFIYLILAVPMLFFGWRALQKVS